MKFNGKQQHNINHNNIVYEWEMKKYTKHERFWLEGVSPIVHNSP